MSTWIPDTELPNNATTSAESSEKEDEKIH